MILHLYVLEKISTTALSYDFVKVTNDLRHHTSLKKLRLKETNVSFPW